MPALPSADEFFGTADPAAKPSADEFFGTQGPPTADEFFGTPESPLSHVARRFTEGNAAVSRAHAGTALAAVENFDVAGAAQDYARPRLPGDADPATNAFLGEQDGQRLRFMEQKALLGGDVAPQQAREQAALDAFQTAQARKSNTLMGEINANSPQQGGDVGGVTGFIGDVAGNLPRLARTIGAGVATAPLAGSGAPAYMAEQIFGETYAGYRQQGKDHERAAIAAGINALAQAPLEYVPTHKFLDMLGSKGGKLAGVAKVMGAEGITEYLQSYPEAFADVYVDNPGKSVGDLARLFVDKVRTGEFQKQAAYEGAVGAVTGGGLAGAAAGAQRLAQGKQGQKAAPVSPQSVSLHAVADRQEQNGAFLDALIKPESGGDINAQAKTSSARGLFQFTEQTRNAVLRATGADAWSQDPAEQRRAAEYLAGRNREQLAEFLGRDPSHQEQYMAWFLGPQGAKEFLQGMAENPDALAKSAASAGAVAANKPIFFDGDRPRTIREVFDLMGGKIGAEAAKVDVFDQVAAKPQSDVRPELQALKEDMLSRAETEQPRALDQSAADPWAIRTVQDAAGEAAGVPRNMARENELRSLRNDIQAREVQQRALEEQGVTLPVRASERLQETQALPQGQGFELVGKPFDPQQQAEAASRQFLSEQIKAARQDAGDPITSFIWGRIDRASINPATGRALNEKFGPGIFAPRGKGFPLDVLTEKLNSTGRPVPPSYGGDPLASYLMDRGVSRRQAISGAVGQAKAEAARMAGGGNVQPSEIRVAFRPEARNFELDDVPFSGGGSFGDGISRADAVRAVSRLQAQAPGAAPLRIISRSEIPERILESARSKGHENAALAIEGWTDHRTGQVFLVHDNLSSVERAAKVWSHEQAAHVGLRKLFGDDARFGVMLRAIQKDYGLESLRHAEEMVARLAEKIDAGEVLSSKDRFHWRKIVDFVRSWLAKHGISSSEENVRALLRQSLRNLGREEAGGKVAAQEATAFSGGGRKQDAHSFVTAPHGGNDFGVITPETASKAGIDPGPIRLQMGWHRRTPGDAYGKGFGAVHIWEGHRSELEALGYRSAEQFVDDVLRKTGEIHRDMARVSKGQDGKKTASRRLAFVVQGEQARRLIVELQKQDGFYSIVTAFPMEPHDAANRYNNRTILARIPLRAAASGQVGPPVASRLKSVSGNLDGTGLGVRSVRSGENTPSAGDVNGPVMFSARSEFQKEHMADWKAPSLLERAKEVDLSRAAGVGKMIWLDKTAPARALAEQAGGKEQARAFDAQARRRAGTHGIVRDMIDENGGGISRYGLAGHESEVIPGSKTLGQIIAPLQGDKAAVRDFESYMAASRTVALGDRNERNFQRLKSIETQLRDVSADLNGEADPGRRRELERLKSALSQEKRDIQAGFVKSLPQESARRELSRLGGMRDLEAFRQMHKELVKFLDDAVLKPRLDAGLLSQEAYDRITKSPEHDFYVAFQREMDATEGGGAVGSPGGPKRIKGSERKIVSPLASVVAEVQRTVREVEQAKTVEALVSLREASPEMAEIIKPMGKGGFTPGRSKAVTTYRDGVAHHWAVPWEVAIGLNGISPQGMRVWRMATFPLRVSAQILRLGATVLSPAFTLRNVARDMVAAASLGDYAHAGRIPGIFLRGLVEHIKDATGRGSDVVSEWRRAGGETGIYTALERSAVELSMQDIVGIRERSPSGAVIHWAASPWRAIKLLNEAGEKATRIGLYENARRRGSTTERAMMESRDTTVDFARSGLAGEMLNQIIPFWNANVQGVEKMVRSLGKPRFWLNVALGVTAPSILEWMAYHDDDEWRELSDFERDFFWHIKTGPGEFIRIPKPFETGAIFGSAAQRALDVMAGHDAEGMGKAGKAIASALTPPVSSPLLTPIIEGKANYSFFSGRPLESKSMEGLPPWMRFNNNTTELAKAVGSMTDISPQKLDNWIRGQFGTAGMDAAKMLDGVISGGKAPAPDRHWYENAPGVSAFVSKEPIGSRSASVNIFYDNLEKTQQAANGSKALQDSGNTDALSRFDRKDVFFAPAFKKVGEDLSSWRQDIAAIQQDMGMSPEEKRRRIDDIERRMTERARGVNESYRTNQPTAEFSFLGQKAIINDQWARAQEIAKEQGGQAAKAYTKPLDLERKHGVIQAISSMLSQGRQLQDKADDPRATPAQRSRMLREAEFITNKAYREYAARSEGWK